MKAAAERFSLYSWLFSLDEFTSGGDTMCEANAYLLKDGKEELFLEALDTVEPENGNLRLTSIFGEQKFIKGKISRLSLVNHKVVIEQTDN
jgi:predicted RNA-binding protein